MNNGKQSLINPHRGNPQKGRQDTHAQASLTLDKDKLKRQELK